MTDELRVPVPVPYHFATGFVPTLPTVLDVAHPPPPPENSFPTPTELLQDIAAHDQNASNQKKRVKRRRATQEAVARGLGYMPTDPDSLSSHDKKRLYLDCLEQYVDYLHTDMVANGFQPVPIERVSSGRGLTSRSIRTLLVHLQTQASALHIQRQEAQLQHSDMHAFYREQLANQDGSGLDYPSAPSYDTHSLAPESPQTPTPITPMSAGPSDYPTYVNASGCYEEAQSAYNPYYNSNVPSADFPTSPQSPYGPGGEQNPSYLAHASTPVASGLVAPAVVAAPVPMSTPTPTPSSVHASGPIPPSFGPGPSSSDAAAFSHAQLVQRRHSIATTASPYYEHDAPFQQHQQHQHNLHLSVLPPQHYGMNGGGSEYASSTISSPTYSDNGGYSYGGAGQGYSAGADAIYYSQQTQQHQQHPQQIPSPTYPNAAGVVVPSNAPPAHHSTPPVVVPSNATPAPVTHMNAFASVFPNPPQGYQFP